MKTEEEIQANYENERYMDKQISKLRRECETVKLHSREYWQLRATYLEKSQDPTYSKVERDHSFSFWYLLCKRTK